MNLGSLNKSLKFGDSTLLSGLVSVLAGSANNESRSVGIIVAVVFMRQPPVSVTCSAAPRAV